MSSRRWERVRNGVDQLEDRLVNRVREREGQRCAVVGSGRPWVIFGGLMGPSRSGPDVSMAFK